MSKVYIFPDTNIFLHFKPFDQIKWNQIFGGNCKIVVAPIVIDELDKHRRNTIKRISNTAKVIAKKFENIIDNPEVETNIVFLNSRPIEQTFIANGLDKREQDDILLASIIEFSVLNADDKVFLVTDDIGPKLKAKSHNIVAKKLPEEFQIPIEDDEETAKLKRLIRENNELRNRIPKVDLYFKGRKKRLIHTIKKDIKSLDKFIEDLMDQERKKYLPMTIEKNNLSENRGLSALALGDLNTIPEDKIQQYNIRLENYFESYKKYLPSFYKYGLNEFLAIPIELEIHNDGNVPAEDIDLWLHFPDGFELFDLAKFNPAPEKPELPTKPKSIMDTFSAGVPLPRMFSTNLSPGPSFRPNSPNIKKTNSYEVTMDCNILKHNQSFHLPVLVAKFSSFEKMIGFEILFKLMINNVPKAVTGKIHVLVK